MPTYRYIDIQRYEFETSDASKRGIEALSRGIEAGDRSIIEIIDSAST